MGEIETFESALQAFASTARVTSDADILRNYAVDGLLPLFVVTPTTTKQAAHVVALANQYGLSLLARGGGSRMSVGNLPERIDVLLETNRLTHVLEHEAPDLTCHVEAGLTLAALQAKLAKKGQWLALDPPDAAQSTVGGILASNASGPKRLRYGSARDLVIGLHVFSNAEDAIGTVIALLGSLLVPSALELVDPAAASDMNDFFGVNLPTNRYTLAIDFEGATATIDRQVDETRQLARKYGVLMVEDLAGESQDHFWEAVREHTQGTVTCKVAILVSQVAIYLQIVEQVCHRHDLEAAVVAHAGNGILFVELRPSDATYRLVEAIAELRLHAKEARGSLVVERCPVDLKRRISVWGEPGSDFYLMQRLKNQFDPNGTFVKGRFVGGL